MSVFTHAVTTNNYGPSKFIVSASPANGTHTTIQAAITAASSGDTIFIRASTSAYVEDITLKAGVNLVSYGANAFNPNVIIQGNTTASYNGTVSISGIQLRTNGGNCLTTSGASTSTLVMINCSVTGVDATAINLNAASFVVTLDNCTCSTVSNNLLYSITTGSLVFKYCTVSCGTGSNTIAAGVVNMSFSNFGEYSVTTSGTGGITTFGCTYTNTNQTIFTLAGTNSALIQNSYLVCGTAIAVTAGAGCTASLVNCSVSSSNANALTGAGIINVGGLSWTGSSSVISSTTQTVYTQDITSTFTPTLTFGGASTGITYNAQEAQYTKIGNILFFAVFISLSNKGSATGTAAIEGLPFPVGGMSSQVGFVQVDNVTFSATFNAPFLRQITSSSTIQLWQTGSGVVGAVLTDTNFSNTSNIRAQGFYYV